MRTYKGNHPDKFSGWMMMLETKDDDNKRWFIWYKRQVDNNEWLTFKIVANEPVDKKANYWFVRNMKNGKLGYVRDFAIMREHRPKLHRHVEGAIKRMFNNIEDN